MKARTKERGVAAKGNRSHKSGRFASNKARNRRIIFFAEGVALYSAK